MFDSPLPIVFDSGQWGQIQTLRCAYRNRNNPNNRNNNIGFRVVVSTFSSLVVKMAGRGWHAVPLFPVEALSGKWRGLFLAEPGLFWQQRPGE